MSKPCAFKCQSLTSHIEGSLRIARMLINEGYADTLSYRLAKALGGNVNPDALNSVAIDMIEISVIFHDIGKALKAYQDSYDNSCLCIERSCGFPYHEVFSILYLYEFLYSLPIRSYGGKLMKAMIVIPLVSTINHMHGLRNYGILRQVESKHIFKKVTENKIYIEREYAEILSKEIVKLKDTYYGIKVDENMLIKVFSNRIDNLDTRLSNVYKEIDNANKFRWAKLYVLVLTPLIIGDNCDSAENRISDPNESKSRKAYIMELCYNSLGYHIRGIISSSGICKK